MFWICNSIGYSVQKSHPTPSHLNLHKIFQLLSFIRKKIVKQTSVTHRATAEKYLQTILPKFVIILRCILTVTDQKWNNFIQVWTKSVSNCSTAKSQNQ
jgi:hypothetical protein